MLDSNEGFLLTSLALKPSQRTKSTMVWIVVFIVIAIIIASGISSSNDKAIEADKKKSEKEEFNKSLDIRVKSYAAFLEKNSSREELRNLSEIELQDHLRTKIKKYNKNIEMAENVAATVLIVGLIFSGAAGLYSSSWTAFFILAGVSLGIGWLIEKKIRSNADSEAMKQGFDIEKLKIDT